MKWSKVQILVFTLLLLFYGLLLLHRIETPVGDDLPRLIQNGKTLFHDIDILTKNVYSYTEPEQPFANHHWLSGVIFWLLHEVVGFGGLVIFKIVVLLSAFSLLFLASVKRANFWVVAWLSVPTIMILRGRTLVRPEIFSYLMISAFLYLLLDAEDHPQKNRIYWLIPLQILWVNLHLFFGVGVLMTAGFLLEKIIQNPKTWRQNQLIRKLGVVLLLLILGCLLNPYGPKGALFSLQLNISKDFPIQILENQSVMTWLRDWTLFSDISVFFFLVAAVVFCLTFLFAWKKRPIFYFSAFLGTALLGSKLLRAIPFFALMFLPGASMNLSGIFEKLRDRFKSTHERQTALLGKVAIGLLVTLLLTLTILRVSGVLFPNAKLQAGLAYRSEDAANFFIKNNLHGPIFNDTDIGSYLIYYLYPQEKVFIDNRFGDAYSEEFVRDIYLPMIQNEEVWQQKQAEYGFNVLFFYEYDKGVGFRDFVYNRLHDPEWVLVHADIYNVIFVRNSPENQVVIDAYGLTPDNVGQRLAHLTEYGVRDDMIAAADIFNMIGRVDLGTQTFLRVVSIWPRLSRIWLILGEWELSFDDGRSPILAMMYLEKSRELGPRTTELYSYLGAAYLRMGLFDKAEEVLRKAQRKNPNLADIQELLDMVEERRKYEPLPNPVVTP
ncbi:MAG: hypothetical protein QG626_379 [Patescibacteria group bacterium]|jgi:tetratricopeptide (TPR) repeat protein|nr:hypothetical protein [Patescibacteria group bacterium]